MNVSPRSVWTTRAPGRGAKRRAVLALAVVLIGIAALTSCIPTGYGWSSRYSANRPAHRTNANVSGAADGHLPASMLVYVNASCRVASPVAGPLVSMLQAAANAGIQLWTVSCYRTYEQQVAVRNSWCTVGRCYMAAVPGTSNHGWGRAVDLGEPGGMTFTSPGHRWLSANAGRYGFVGLSFEAWHWSYVG